MAQATTAVLGRIALRRVPACAVPAAARAESARAPGAAGRPHAPADAPEEPQPALQAVLAYLAMT